MHFSYFPFSLAFLFLTFSFCHHFCSWCCLLYNKNSSKPVLQDLFMVGFSPSPSLCWLIRWEIVDLGIPRCCPKVFQLSWVTKTVAIASGFLLLILEYNSGHVKWKEKLIFAAINIREFLSSERSNFIIPITCSIIKGHIWHYCKNRAAVLLNVLILCATVARTVVDFKLCSRGPESQPRICRAGWFFPFKACSCPQMTLCSTG